MFKMMFKAIGGDYEALLNETTMIAAAQKVFENIALQIANNRLVSHSNGTLQRHIWGTENRLHVRGLSLWLMVLGLFLMSLLSITILLSRPPDVVPQNPETIATVVILLSRSQDVQRIFEGSDQDDPSTMKERLLLCRFQTRASQGDGSSTPIFKLEAEDLKPTSRECIRRSIPRF